jgi:hypothetical protein
LNVKFYRASKKEIRDYLRPIIFEKDTKSLLYTSTALLVLSKSLAIASPFFLKITVNALAIAS